MTARPAPEPISIDDEALQAQAALAEFSHGLPVYAGPDLPMSEVYLSAVFDPALTYGIALGSRPDN